MLMFLLIGLLGLGDGAGIRGQVSAGIQLNVAEGDYDPVAEAISIANAAAAAMFGVAGYVDASRVANQTYADSVDTLLAIKGQAADAVKELYWAKKQKHDLEKVVKKRNKDLKEASKLAVYMIAKAKKEKMRCDFVKDAKDRAKKLMHEMEGQEKEREADEVMRHAGVIQAATVLRQAKQKVEKQAEVIEETEPTLGEAMADYARAAQEAVSNVVVTGENLLADAERDKVAASVSERDQQQDQNSQAFYLTAKAELRTNYTRHLQVQLNEEAAEMELKAAKAGAAVLAAKQAAAMAAVADEVETTTVGPSEMYNDDSDASPQVLQVISGGSHSNYDDPYVTPPPRNATAQPYVTPSRGNTTAQNRTIAR